MMKNILLIALMTFCFGTLNAQKTSSVHLIDPAALRLAIAKTSPLIIDVRTPQEYNEGHIAHAVNIDFLAQDSFVQKIAALDKAQSVYLYCRSGNRSGKAALQLDSLGFKHIYDLEGGYTEWQE